mmetsp:Transcript_17022/g.20041  ORF Transcript_17022/g.20041 Transcript_17022/m.20041 type:complete len:923 (-) Transcript_17022:192-2960(-)
MDEVYSFASSSRSNTHKSKNALREELSSKNLRLGVEMNNVQKGSEEENNEIEEIGASIITDDKLRKITGSQDLSSVTQLELIVDSSKNSTLEVLGFLLPSLQRLSLDTSCLTSLRDLGTDLRVLQTLSLIDTGLTELDGVSALPCLRELILKRNQISDLTPLCTHDSLQILDLSENNITNIDALEILGTCNKLYSLDLRNNLIEKGLQAFTNTEGSHVSSSLDTTATKKGYREVVVYHIPTLKVLDSLHLKFALVDASFIAEATTFLTLYVTKNHSNPTGSGGYEEGDVQDAQLPWQTPLGQQGGLSSASNSNKSIPILNSLDTSSSLTQTTGGLTFAGAPTALLRKKKKCLKNPALLSKSTPLCLNSLSHSLEEGADAEVLKNMEEERQLVSSQTNNTSHMERKQRKSRRKKSEKLTSSSFDVSTVKERRQMSNQSPSPTEDNSMKETLRRLSREDSETLDSPRNDLAEGNGGLMEAWRASRPCSSDDALPRVRTFASPGGWGVEGPISASSPNTGTNQQGRGFDEAPAMSMSFEADGTGAASMRPHSAHSSTPATVPHFLMMQETSISEELEPSCDDIDLSFRSAQKQFSGQRRRRQRGKGLGWQSSGVNTRLDKDNEGGISPQEKLLVAPDMSASSWDIDQGVLVPKFAKGSKSDTGGNDTRSDDSDNEDTQHMTRASMKARAKAMSGSSMKQPVTTHSKGFSRSGRIGSFLETDEEEEEVDLGATHEQTRVSSHTDRQESRSDEVEPSSTSSGSSHSRAAGKLGFDLQGSLNKIEEWTDVSEMSSRKQRKRLEAAKNKQREAALLSSKPTLLSPKCSNPQSDEVVRKSAVFRECQSDGVEEERSASSSEGVGVGMSDGDLIDMLRQPPKHVPQLRTRDSFRSFFRGCCAARMRHLLEQACEDEKKVNKRFDLVKDILI